MCWLTPAKRNETSIKVMLSPFDPKVTAWREARGCPSVFFKQTRCLHMGNTVKVNLGDNVWYLGFVQDTEPDRLFVNFRCEAKTTSWVSIQNLWPHDVEKRFSLGDISAGTRIRVAIRENKEAPLMFKPAKLSRDSAMAGAYLTAVQLCTGDNDNCCRIVHRCQLTKETELLPENSLFARQFQGQFQGQLPGQFHGLPPEQLQGLIPGQLQNLLPGMYVKYIVPFDSAHAVSGIDECRVHDEIKKALYLIASSHNSTVHVPGYDHIRFYLEFRSDYLVFIGWHQGLIFWTPEHLAKALSNCRANGAIFYKETISHCVMRNPDYDGIKKDNVNLKFIIPELLIQTLLHLDYYAQAHLKRLCKKWKNALESGWLASHITVDFRRWMPKFRHADQSFELCSLMDNIASGGLKTLSVHNWELHAYKVTALQNYMKLNRFNLVAIKLSDCVVLDEISRVASHWGKMKHLQTLAAACDHLIIVRYTIMDVAASSLAMLSRIPRFSCPPMERLSSVSTIPKFQFDRTRSEMEQFNLFLSTADEFCADISETNRQRIIAVFKMWTASLQTHQQITALQEFLL